ncbi:MAG: DinB family protein [Candidatus Dormibacterales bacterium]
MAAGPAHEVAPFYKGWDAYQQRLVDALSPLSAEELRLKAAPHLWSIGMLGLHVVATRAWWFYGWMREGGPEFEAIQEWDEGDPPAERPAGEIVEGLRATWAMMEDALRRWTSVDLDEVFQRPVPNPSGERHRHPRQWILWHVAEHDMHHGGEISFSLGIHGLRGLDL